MVRGAVLSLVLALMATVALRPASISLADDDGCGAGNNPYNRPDGTLIQGPGTPVYLIEGCQKVWIPWFEDLSSHRFPLNSVAQVSTAEVNATGSQGYQLRGREGTILKSDANFLYIIDEISPGNYQKRYITGTAWSLWFGPCSYNNSHLQSASYEYLNTYPNGLDVSASRPDGMLLQAPSPNLQIYLIENSQRRYIEGTPTHFDGLNSYNFLQPVCSVSQAEINGYAQLSPAKRAREGTLFNSSGGPVYIVERDPNLGYWKRWILSADAFNYYGLSWGAIQNWYGPRVDTYTTTAHVHPMKSVYAGRWNQQLVCDPIVGYCDYAGWITLKEVRQYPPPCGNCAANWTAAIDGAIGTWNTRPTTARFSSQGSPPYQVYIIPNDYPDAWLGKTFFYDSNSQNCGDASRVPGSGVREV